MRIFADQGVTSVCDIFKDLGTVTTASGRQIRSEMLADTDVLLVRSVTRVDPTLLAGTPVRLVGTATAGTDHIDIQGLKSMGIEVVHAPGCNAPSVCDYVIAALLALSVREQRALPGLLCAVIGCGAVGSRLSAKLEALGLEVLRCDPPLNDALVASGHPSPFVDLDTAMHEADIVTLHVPLHNVAPHGTYGLIGSNHLHLLKGTAWFVNASRGLVADEASLAAWLDHHPNGRAVIDVWANEPNLSCDLMKKTTIGTSHIAGYAVEGKLRATQMLRTAVLKWLDETGPTTRPAATHIAVETEIHDQTSDEEWLCHLVKCVYDIEADHRALAPICGIQTNDRPDFFESLRRDYPTRHEFSRYEIASSLVPTHLEEAVRNGLGMKIGPGSRVE